MDLELNLCIAKSAARAAGNFLLENKNKNKKIFSEQGRDNKLENDR